MHQSRDSLRQRDMGKFGSLRCELCDNLLTEEHRPPSIRRTPSLLREVQDIPCAARDECLGRTGQTDSRQWEHCCLDPPVIDFKSFQLGNEEPLGEFLIYKYRALASTQVCAMNSSILKAFHS